jgi:hypothetical protein
MRVSLPSVVAIALLSALLSPRLAVAQVNRSASGNLPLVGAAAPPPPIAPDTVARNVEGGVSVRAVRISEPIKLDGRLDEEVYTQVPAISDFIQQEPYEGEPATEKTEVWVLFDDKNLYVTSRMWDSHPEREIANEMRRDGTSILQSETFSVIFDTFNDKRNGFLFYLTPLGGLMDIQITDETNRNADWNTVWDARTSKWEHGWNVEIVIPFRSLRYNPGSNQVWGVNFRRVVRWKNEWSYLTRIPAPLAGGGIFHVSIAGELHGLEVPSGGMNLEVKPYGISRVRTDLLAKPTPFSNSRSSDWGLDTKYGVTKSLVADFTYNTDFAQVEDDTQQVNLTRFQLYFPEKRDFFLEGQGTYGFAGGSSGAGGGGEAPLLFFSRRIGLNGGTPVPIETGERLTGKQGAYAIGALNMQTKEDVASKSPATNFSVLRVKRDLFKRSYVGAMYTRRSKASTGPGVAETLGIDSLYAPSPAFSITSYFAKTYDPPLVLRPDGERDRGTSYRVDAEYNADRYGAEMDHLYVGTNFNPDVGYMRRKEAFQRDYAMVRFSPRPNRNHMKRIRQFKYQGSIDYYENMAGRVDSRINQGVFGITFQNSDSLSSQVTRTYEFIPAPFGIASGVTVPVGGYTYNSFYNSYTFGTQRMVSGTLSVDRGTLYNGDKTTLGWSSGRLKFSPRLAIEPSFSMNWVNLPYGDFKTSVAANRTIFTVTPRMFFTALMQYNSASHSFTTNARLRWEYQPGSEMFVVFSDGRDTLGSGFPGMVNRAFIVKINHLFRF